MKTRSVSIGLFVVGGLLLFGLGMFLIGDRHQVFARRTEYYSEFVNLAGLEKGAKVRVAGMDAGQVLAIGVPDSPSSRFRVKWRIDAKLRGLVRSDSLATIGTEGIVGGTYLSVRPGSAQAPESQALATIASKEPTDLSELLARGNGLLDHADGMLKQVTTTISNVNDVVVNLKQGRGTVGMLLSDDKLANHIRETVTSATTNVQDIVADLKAGRGPAGMLLRDEALASRIRDTVNNAQQATADLGHASRQADALVSDLNSRQLPQKAGELMDNLNDTARQARQMISEVNKPDQFGMSAGANIRESLTNANTATGNLADATEALKHNFLTRGFFKKRGYYNLTDISPDQYRKDRAFTDPHNHRVWLSGPELFQHGSNGEEISAKGKALLNAALTQNGDPIVDGPIVIEGYSNGEAPADQLRFSRSRAILVRQYLQARFQLDPRNMGVVPLMNLPPKGMERAAWDGICIVVVRKG
ncbi:MAG TPA: MlaD family protein [Bryobacteraceae bacterium]|nr:MlaD family protein [Bryobacteraceae bacterium]